GRRIHQHTDAPHALALLRAGRERPRRHAAEQRYELAPSFIEHGGSPMRSVCCNCTLPHWHRQVLRADPEFLKPKIAALQDFDPADVGFGSRESNWSRLQHFRFYLMSGRSTDMR